MNRFHHPSRVVFHTFIGLQRPAHVRYFSVFFSQAFGVSSNLSFSTLFDFSFLLYCNFAVLSRASFALHFPSVPRLLLSIPPSRLSLIPLSTILTLPGYASAYLVLCLYFCLTASFDPLYFSRPPFDRPDCSLVHSSLLTFTCIYITQTSFCFAAHKTDVSCFREELRGGPP